MIDSGALIAYTYEQNQYRERAREILPEFMKNNRRHITDYVLLEVTNFLLRKVSFEAAQKTFRQLTNSKEIQVIYNDEVSFNATAKIFDKGRGLSFTDANIVFHMQQLGLKELLSFDAGFDKVREIKRIR